ncbi:MAG: hypothetical protein JST90_18140 [Bacteroidetes bacterium]|nr:hypothetical protein [Bacteroidota bacterium]
MKTQGRGCISRPFYFLDKYDLFYFVKAAAFPLVFPSFFDLSQPFAPQISGAIFLLNIYPQNGPLLSVFSRVET